MPIKFILFLTIILSHSVLYSSAQAASRCLLLLGEKDANMSTKAQNSTYVFEGVVTEVTPTDINVNVTQYFKGTGSSTVKVARNPTNCTNSFTVNQTGLFFTEGTMQSQLKLVHDDQSNSSKAINVDNFNQVSAIKNCMARYQQGELIIPCIVHQNTQKFYKASLKTLSAPKALIFGLTNLAEIPPEKADCVATYSSGNLTIPCISHDGSQKIYQAFLKTTDNAKVLNFSVKSSHIVTNIIDLAIFNDNFDTGNAGASPEQWQIGITGEGNYQWQLEQESSAPSGGFVFALKGEGDYAWAVKKETQISNGFVATKFKAISGDIDQAAGLIWRWKDANNYYVARANALEDNISIYYVEDGVRNTLFYEDLPVDTPINQNVWRDLRVDFKDDSFKVSFEGKVIFTIKDKRIEGAGAVGLWIKQDSETLFDNFSYGKQINHE